MLHAGQSIGVEAVAADCRRVAPAAAVSEGRERTTARVCLLLGNESDLYLISSS